MAKKTIQERMNEAGLRPTAVVTVGVDHLRRKKGFDPREAIRRHLEGDWGEMPEEDVAAMERALEEGYMDQMMSSFKTDSGEKVWVITDPGWEVVTVLLPSEY